MKVNAYLLLADPTWLRTSVSMYYDRVDRIVASYDASSRGWTGAQVRTEECLAALRSIDRDGKVDFRPGDFVRTDISPLEAETIQRQAALDVASDGADWVLQLDTDEVLPSFEPLATMMHRADELGIPAVEWPMRVLYRALRGEAYLQVIDDPEHLHFDYPGAVLVRSGTRLSTARRADGRYIRPVVEGHARSLQVSRPAEADEVRLQGIAAEEAIWHNSWARPIGQTVHKISSWGHNAGARSWLYFARRWLPAPLTWRGGRRWHPFAPDLWPRLARVDQLPFGVHPEDCR